MAPRKEAVTVTEEVEETAAAAPEETAPAVQPVTVQPTTKSARVKGTWTMYWGTLVFDFVDGERYDIPVDLFEYLKQHSNIYDTL